jgi:hypothetical protein
MIGHIFSYHIFWKEYRQMRGFWLSVLAIAVALQLIAFAFSAGQFPLYPLAISFAALYTLGCGATMFAMEHENGTYDFLRALPTKAIPTFLGKVAFTVISAPLLFAATWGFAALISSLGGRTIYIEWDIVGVWCLGSLVLFAWATLFSLLLQNVVKAALLGGVAGCVSVPLAARMVHELFDLRDGGLPAVAVLIVFVAALICVDIWLGARWYREAVTRSGADDMARRREEFANSYGAYEIESVASKGSMFAHLLWLQWRQSRGMILILTGLVAWFGLALGTIGVLDMVAREYLRYFRVLGPMFIAFGVLAGTAVLPVAGASVFAGDQKRNQFRFFADRGLPPKTVWWSRHPIWIGAIAVWLAALLIPALIFAAGWARHEDTNFMVSWSLLPVALRILLPGVLCLPLAYCFGQLCSMFFRSGILAITASIAGSYMLAWWAFAMSILNVPLIWSVVPIPVILLIATRVRTRGWLIESNTLRSWLPVVLILVVPGGAILSGVCLYRVYSVPWVEPGFDVAAFTVPASAEAVETGKMYRRAHELLAAEETADEALELIVEASRRPECDDVAKSFPNLARFDTVRGLAAPILDEGKRLQDQGDLDGAAEQYLTALQMARQLYQHTTQPMVIAGIEQDALSALVDWSIAPGQSKARIVSVIREVEGLVGDFVPVENAIKAHYVQASGAIDGDLDGMFRWLGIRERELTLTAPLLIHWLPWEQARARRNLRQVTLTGLDRCQRAKEDLVAGGQVVVPQLPPIAESMWLQMNPDVWLAPLSAGWSGELLALTELERRSALIQMALAAWQIEHESLPQSLEKLQGSYLRTVPLDPFSGGHFVYFPKGFEKSVSDFVPSTDLATANMLESGKPFFWSTGAEVSVVKPGETSPTAKYKLQRGNRYPGSAQQVWAAGRIFQIPQPR